MLTNEHVDLCGMFRVLHVYLWWFCCWVTVFVPVIELNWIEWYLGWSPSWPAAPRLYTGSLCPVPLAKFRMTCILSFLIASGSKKNETRYVCLREAKVSQSHKMWTEVSYSVPHFLRVGLLVSPIIYKCLPKVLCPVSRPITSLDYVHHTV
jgi:hypothetical protein